MRAEPRGGRCPVWGPYGRTHIPSTYTDTCLQCGRPLANEPDQEQLHESFVDDAIRARPGGYRRLGRVSPYRPDRADELDPIDRDPEDDPR